MEPPGVERAPTGTSMPRAAPATDPVAELVGRLLIGKVANGAAGED